MFAVWITRPSRCVSFSSFVSPGLLINLLDLNSKQPYVRCTSINGSNPGFSRVYVLATTSTYITTPTPHTISSAYITICHSTIYTNAHHDSANFSVPFARHSYNSHSITLCQSYYNNDIQRIHLLSWHSRRRIT